LGAYRPSFDSGPVDTPSDPGTQLNTSPGSSEDKRDIPYRANVAPNAQPTDSGDVLPPFASLLRDRDEDDEEEDRDEEYGTATLPIILLPQPESALSSAFRAFQLPSEISQADFIHLAIQFVFESYGNLQHFRNADNVDYDEGALATSFSYYRMII